MVLLRGFMLKTVVITLGLLATGCSVGAVDGIGGDDTPTPDGPGNDPRAGTFAAQVLPLFDGKGCNNVSCHGGVQNPQLRSFELMTTNGLPGRYLTTPSASNILITKGEHQNAPYLDAIEIGSVATWIDSGP